MTKPHPTEYAPYYANYVNLVTQQNGIDALHQSGKELLTSLKSVPSQKATFRYADGKWSINEVVQHMIDAEIVFNYRALRIARGDKTPLPGFDQDAYATNAFADEKSLKELISLFETTRKYSEALFRSFHPSTHENVGQASNVEVSVRALCFITAGHTIHHYNVLKERYL